MTKYVNIPKYLYSLLLSGALLFAACTKDGGIIENRLVVTKIDRSIPTDYNIVEFNVVSENICFAIGQKDDAFKLFKTLNGGQSWQEMSSPGFTSVWDLVIQSIVFFDANNGVIVLDNRAFRTYNGGASWSTVGVSTPSDYSNDFIYAGKTEANELILVESNGNSWIPNDIFKSSPSSTQYTTLATFDHDGSRHDYGHYSNGKFFYLMRDFNIWDDKVYVFDIATGQIDTIDVPGVAPMDAMFADGRILFARKLGKLNFNDWSSDVWNVDFYNFHNEDYYSIEHIDDYFVAVANGSISSNYNGVWEEVINTDGTGHTEQFFKIQKIDNSNFYISGENGLFFKATFK